MEAQNPFSLTLTNESEIFSNNSIYSFRSPINPPIQLPFNQWQVALTKIVIPHTRLIHLPNSEFLLELKNIPGFSLTVTVAKQYFTSLESLIDILETYIMNAVLEVFVRHPRLTQPPYSFVGVEFTIENRDGRVDISRCGLLSLSGGESQDLRVALTVIKGIELWHILGFTNLNPNRSYEFPLRAKEIPSFKSEASLLALYAPNMVVETLIGDRLRPILELIPYDSSSEADFGLFSQVSPIYKRIRGGYINHVQLELEDIDQKHLFFESGKLQLELHFKPCRPMK